MARAASTRWRISAELDAVILAAQFFVRYGRHFDVQVDPIKQRSADFAQIALDDRARAAAFTR
jgi:hypothetical protein